MNRDTEEAFNPEIPVPISKVEVNGILSVGRDITRDPLRDNFKPNRVEWYVTCGYNIWVYESATLTVMEA